MWPYFNVHLECYMFRQVWLYSNADFAKVQVPCSYESSFILYIEQFLGSHSISLIMLPSKMWKWFEILCYFFFVVP